MPKEHKPQRLDVRAFAEQAAELAGTSVIANHERLAAETQGRGLDESIAWRIRGELRNPQHLQPEIWLHLHAGTQLLLTCQRCLEPVLTPVSIDRSFRFVPDEATAEAEDDESEVDLLALSPQFDLFELMEDELLMAMPLVPRHEQCSPPLPAGGSPPAEPAGSERPHPFAILGQLKGRG